MNLANLCVLIAFIAAYAAIGIVIFRSAVDDIGGKQAYLDSMDVKYESSRLLAYYIAFGLLLFFWPYFLIKGLIERKK